MRYIVDTAKKLYHDTFYSTEQCNLDDSRFSTRKYQTDEKPPELLFRLCKHCAKQSEKEKQ